MSSFTAVIFDLDGTLIDSSEGVVESVNYSLRQMGEPEQPAENIKPFIGFPLSSMYPHFTDKPMEQLYKHFQVKAAETVVSSTILLPEVEETLSDLHKTGYRLAIASTKIRRHIEGVIKKFNWGEYFEVYAGGNEVTNVKPDPEIMRLVLQRLNISADMAVMVGDTVNDVVAAKGVPMSVIAVEPPYGGKDDLLTAEPTEFISKLGNLPDLLKRMQQ